MSKGRENWGETLYGGGGAEEEQFWKLKGESLLGRVINTVSRMGL